LYEIDRVKDGVREIPIEIDLLMGLRDEVLGDGLGFIFVLVVFV
jgi:hypothetical protein